MNSRTILSLWSFVVASASLAAGFDLEAYRTHLQQNRDLPASTLIERHHPYGPYLDHVMPPVAVPEYLDSIVTRYELTPGEQDLLDRNGFMVSERLAYPSFGEALLDVWRADLPVFVSSDAILHAMHASYDKILASVEDQFLYDDLWATLDALYMAWPDLDAHYGGNPSMRASLDDVDVYVTVALSLLAGARLPSAGGNDATVIELLDLIDAEQPCRYPLFNEAPRICDFSQMRVRGHYTQSETLGRYFRSMMWLGRTEMRLTPPPDAVIDVTREIVDAFLVRELVNNTAAGGSLQEMEGILQPLVGTPDNITLPELERLFEALDLERVDALLDTGMQSLFRAELDTGRYRAQAINSQVLFSDILDPKPMELPYTFVLIGQRFVLDSYISANVVYDRIVYQNRKVFRGLPTSLDVLYALGNDDVLPLLETELETYHYASNLDALRFLIDGYEPEFWRQSLYTVWLQSIRSLAGTGRQTGIPDFMRTVAWQQEKMNTQLASWTELRHDNLLYAKQSYTGGATCSFPRSYVEPVPELYRVLETFGLGAVTAFAALPPGTSRDRIVGFFGEWAATMSRLGTIADKELTGTMLTGDELQFLHEMLFLGMAGCTTVEQGWYRRLYFSYADTPTSEPDLLVADVHTQPTDAAGNFVGRVLHVGTGNPDLGVFVAAPPGMPLTAFVGPVASFHEHVTLDFERLTDEDWQTLYAQSVPDRPDWTFAYLADEGGEPRNGGRRIPAGDVEPPAPASPPHAPRLVLAQNYPNPFNPETNIPFRIDVQAPVAVHLEIYDARGRHVRTLFADTLPAGTYHARWNGLDDNGYETASGTYVVRVRAGSTEATRKIVLLK